MTTRRALLLGAPVLGLRGVAGDLQLMRASLQRRGFAVTEVPAATRGAISQALAHLAAEVERDDVVLVYFSGHGAQVELPGPAATRNGRAHARASFLVCADFEHTRVDDFRGFGCDELSDAIERLTSVTKNVSVVLDCCFAGVMVRGAGARAGVRHTRLTDVQQRAALAHLGAYARTSPHAEANPFAIRVLAAGAREPAYEIEHGSTHAGALTVALAGELARDEVERQTWAALGRVLAGRPELARQTSAIEGPQRRYVFSCEEHEQLGEVALVDGCPDRIAAGALMDVRVGDVYCAGERETAVRAVALVEATMREPLPARTRVQLVRCAQPRARVELCGIAPSSDLAAMLRASLTAGGMLALEGDALPLAGRVRLRDDAGQARLCLEADGLVLGCWPFDLRSRAHARRLVDHLAAQLRRLARARLLGMLPQGELDGGRITWGLVAQGRASELPMRGATLRADARIYVRIVGGAAARWGSVLYVGADATIEVLSRRQGGGIDLVATPDYQLGEHQGVELPAPRAREAASPRRASLVVVLSSEAIDLRSWEQRGVEDFVDAPRRPITPSRNVTLRRGQSDPRHRLERIDFELS
jgi:hypothetical protein